MLNLRKRITLRMRINTNTTKLPISDNEENVLWSASIVSQLLPLHTGARVGTKLSSPISTIIMSANSIKKNKKQFWLYWSFQKYRLEVILINTGQNSNYRAFSSGNWILPKIFYVFTLIYCLFTNLWIIVNNFCPMR